MIILVLNCGSSSLKYQLLDMKGDEVYDLMAKGLVERIGMDAGCIKPFTDEGVSSVLFMISAPSMGTAMKNALPRLSGNNHLFFMINLSFYWS